jgi:hypothetical protein
MPACKYDHMTRLQASGCKASTSECDMFFFCSSALGARGNIRSKMLVTSTNKQYFYMGLGSNPGSHFGLVM